MSKSHHDPDAVDRRLDAGQIARDLTLVEQRPRAHRVEIPDDPLASFGSEADGPFDQQIAGTAPRIPARGATTVASMSPRQATIVARTAAGLSLAIRVEWLARQARRHPRIPSALRIACAVAIGVILGAAYVRYVAPVDSSVSAPPISIVSAPHETPGAPDAPPAVPRAPAMVPPIVSSPPAATAARLPAATDRAVTVPKTRVPPESQPIRGPSGRKPNGSGSVAGVATTGVELVTPATIEALPTVGPAPVGLTADPVPAAGERSAEAIDRSDIQAVLDAYRLAYEQLDPVAASSLWPSVDTRALARAFGTLSRQRVSFDRCDINLAGGRATARCNGGIQYVRRVGDAQPQSRSISWTFTLDRSSGQWRIAGVSAR